MGGRRVQPRRSLLSCSPRAAGLNRFRAQGLAVGRAGHLRHAVRRRWADLERRRTARRPSVHGLGAAMIFPAHLVADHQRVHRKRKQRAQAIGLWGATIARVADGPIVGGWLLQHFSERASSTPWGRSLRLSVSSPSRRRRCRPPVRLDARAGRPAGFRAVGRRDGPLIVYVLIQAPTYGWWSSGVRTLAGYRQVALGRDLRGLERRVEHP